MESIESSRVPPALGGYSQALRIVGADELLFISGQIPEDRDGDIPSGFTAQCEQVWANVVAQLDAAGMEVADLVKVTTYLSDRQHAAENSRIRAAVLGEHRPALTVLIAGIFDPRWLLEIEAIAAR